MRLRLHSAIALVSWHLISPIGDPAKPGVLPAKTPVSQWRNLGSFDSSEQCQKALTDLRASFEQDTRREISAWRKQKDNSQVERALQAAAAQAVAGRSLCIASNDPRLKQAASESHAASPVQTRGAAPGPRASAQIGNQEKSTPADRATTGTSPWRGRVWLGMRPAEQGTSIVQANSAPALPTSVVTVPPGADESPNRAHSPPHPSLKTTDRTDLTTPVTIASAGNLTFWRLTTGGVIARSSDGTHWRPLNSGTTSDLFAGAAPSAEICWVVGRGGTVLRTVDGEQWQAIASPTDADLVSVAASDELSATVSASDGRQFTTHDGGHSWQLTGTAQGRIGKRM
ncbi:MAG: hypothetical protein JO121_09045 [Deltaproteobacteria bacterium]|nr:hypothetical protein [Deltaproteobacteria bacterium]